MATQNNDKMSGLTRKEASLLAILAAANKRVFTFPEAAAAVGGASAEVRRLLYQLTRKRWLERLEKGKYLIVSFEAGLERQYAEHEFLVASKLIDPYYIGYRTALNFYGYTEQVSRTVYVVTTKRKKPLTVSNVTYRFVSLPAAKIYGLNQIWMSGERINISDREKTLVDCLDHLNYAGGVIEVAKGLWLGKEEIDLKKVVEYGERIGNKSVMQRLGFLFELLRLGDDGLLSRIARSCSKSYAKLDSLGGDFGRYHSKWRLRVNVSEYNLTEWQRY